MRIPVDLKLWAQGAPEKAYGALGPLRLVPAHELKSPIPYRHSYPLRRNSRQSLLAGDVTSGLAVVMGFELSFCLYMDVVFQATLRAMKAPAIQIPKISGFWFQQPYLCNEV